MALEAWQVALRRQFAKEQKFRVKNIGAQPIFSEFHVTNPQSGKTYRVAIRGERLGDNYCSCPDFATNTLGTCKHVEFTLAKLRRQRGAKAALAKGFQPPYSEVYLRYGAKREVIFGPGVACPAPLKTLAATYFDASGVLRPDAYERVHVFLKTAMAGDHEVRSYDDALAFIAQVRDGADLARRIAAGRPPSAILFNDDWVALGGIYELARQGYRIPDDVSVVGYDNTAIAEDLSPSLSSIDNREGEVIRQAFAMLQERMDGVAGPPRQRSVPSRLVWRESCARVASTAHGEAAP
jgi:hypothetical protein